MLAKNKAAFIQVLYSAKKLEKDLRRLLDHSKHLSLEAVSLLATTIESVLLENNADLDKAETRRFSELVTGIADRMNHIALKEAQDLMPDGMKIFKDTKRSIILDERYDIQDKLSSSYQVILNNWLAGGCQPNDETQGKLNFFHSLAAAAKHCDPLVQKDIESYISQKFQQQVTNEGDGHLAALRALINKA